MNCGKLRNQNRLSGWCFNNQWIVCLYHIKIRQSSNESRGRVYGPEQFHRRHGSHSHHPGDFLYHDGFTVRENSFGHRRNRVHLPTKFNISRIFVIRFQSLRKRKDKHKLMSAIFKNNLVPYFYRDQIFFHF